MIKPEYDCQEESIVGPLELERFKQNERSRSTDYPHMVYDQDYFTYVQRNHGGVPKRQWFMTEKGSVQRLGRFVNFGGPYKKPFQEDWQYPGEDIRVSWSMGALEAIANIADGCGAFLVPFGLLYKGRHSPEEIGTTYINLVCFDYSNDQLDAPEVVVWNNSDACKEYYACEESELDSWTGMRHDRFTQRVTDNFNQFLHLLCESETQLKLTE